MVLDVEEKPGRASLFVLLIANMLIAKQAKVIPASHRSRSNL